MGTIADKLAKLNTTKAELKSAINGSGNVVGDVFSAYPFAISSGKSAIASAITEKGVETGIDATFRQMADNISKIESSPVYQTSTLTIYSTIGFGVCYPYIENGKILYKEVTQNGDVQTVQNYPVFFWYKNPSSYSPYLSGITEFQNILSIPLTNAKIIIGTITASNSLIRIAYG